MAATYRLEFTDRLKVDWKVDFLIDGGGDVTSMLGTGDPINIEYLSSSEELFDSPVKGSTADISVFSTSLFQWLGLYAEGDLDTKVNIYYNNAGYVLFWTGYIISGAYTEPYDNVPCPVTITVGDGLGYLKKLDFKNAGADYTGRQTDAWIIWTVLSKINATSFSEYINLYEDTMDATATDSPLDQVETDVMIFQNDDCYDVLEEVLRKYNACLRQVNGIFVIYRPLELYNATTSGRTYTDATTHGAAATLTPNVLFSRVAALTDIKQHNGGDLFIQPGAENMDIVQDFGDVESWVQNYNFNIANYNTATSTFNNWTNNGSSVQAPIQNYIPDEYEGIVITSNMISLYTMFANQQFGADLNTAVGDETFISFEWQWINRSTDDYVNPIFRLGIKHIDENKWLIDSGEGVNAHWYAPEAHIRITDDVPAGNSGWKTYTRSITGGVPGTGPWLARIFAIDGYADTVFMAIKNLKIWSTSNEIRSWRRRILITVNDNVFFIYRGHTLHETTEVKSVVEVTTSYTPSGGIKGIDIEYVYRLGDVDPAVTNVTNTIEQFAGCLTTDGNETTAWSTITPGGESAKLLALIGAELNIQYARPRQALSVPVYEGNTVASIPQIKLLGSFQDSLNKFEAVNKRFVFNSGRFDIRNRRWDLDLVEIISTIP